MRDETGVGESSTVHPMGATVSLSSASVTLATEDTGTSMGVGNNSDDVATDTVALELTISAESTSPVLLPDQTGIDVPGTLLSGQAAHHIRVDETLVPSYFRLAAAYGQAGLPTETTVSGLILYQPTSGEGQSAEPDTVAVTLPATEGTATRTLRWHRAPAEESVDESEDKPADGEPDETREQTQIGDRSDERGNSNAESEQSVPESTLPAPTDQTNEPASIADTHSGSEASAEACPDCGADTKPSYDFCGNCGAPL